MTREWQTGDALLEIKEHETVLAPAEVVEALPAEMWGGVGLSVRRHLGDPEGRWRVSAGQYVGLARLGSRGGYRPHLSVRPKIAADIFFLSDYAFEAERDLLADQELQAELAALSEDPAACLLAWFLAEAEAFAKRWIRRDYILKREVFEGRVRGRLLVADYARTFVPRAQAHRAPCQFFELTQNNLANQILKAAVRRVAKVARLVPVTAARQTLERRVNRLLPLFAGISDITVVRGDYNRLRLRGALRHYGPMIRKSRAMLEGMYVSEALGPRTEDAFLWDMNVLFERSLRGIIASWPEGSLATIRSSARIVDGDGHVKRRSKVAPDLVLTTQDGRLILDAKYKDTDSREVEEGDAEITVARSRFRVGRADIYQAISYGQHLKLKPATVGLVYPVSLAEDEQLPAPLRVVGFSEDVYLLFLDVGPQARGNLPAFYEALGNIIPSSLKYSGSVL